MVFNTQARDEVTPEKLGAADVAGDRFNSIPGELKKLNRWLLWMPVPRKDGKKPTKVPFQGINPDAPASTKDPSTWCSFETCSEVEASEVGFGIGLVLTDTDVVGIDLDNCVLPDGSVAPWAKRILEQAGDAYIEWSVSGEGLHIIGKGTGPKPAKEKFVTEAGGGVEVFRKATRYLTFSGREGQRLRRAGEHR